MRERKLRGIMMRYVGKINFYIQTKFEAVFKILQVGVKIQLFFTIILSMIKTLSVLNFRVYQR